MLLASTSVCYCQLLVGLHEADTSHENVWNNTILLNIDINDIRFFIFKGIKVYIEKLE